MADEKPSIDKLREMKARLNVGRKQLGNLKYDLSDADYAKAVDMFSKKEKEFDTLSRGAFRDDIHHVKGTGGKINTNEIIAKLDNKADIIDNNEITSRFKNSTEHIDTRPIQKVKSGGEFVTDIADKLTAKKAAIQGLKKGGSALGKKFGMAALGSLPVIGGVASAFQTGDVMAAMPVVGDVIESDPLGLQKGMEGYSHEMPNLGESVEQGKLPGRLSDATMGALNDIAMLRAKKRKNLVEE